MYPLCCGLKWLFLKSSHTSGFHMFPNSKQGGHGKHRRRWVQTWHSENLCLCVKRLSKRQASSPREGWTGVCPRFVSVEATSVRAMSRYNFQGTGASLFLPSSRMRMSYANFIVMQTSEQNSPVFSPPPIEICLGKYFRCSEPGLYGRK